MTSPPFKIGDRVVCVDASGRDLALHGVYSVYKVTQNGVAWFIAIAPGCCNELYLASRFTLEQPATAPDDYPDSVEDYAHNRPHRIIAWGAAGLLMWLMFFAGLWLGWWLL